MLFKKIFFYSFFLISLNLFSQENENKGDFEIMLSYGNSKVEIEDLESIGYFTSAKFKKEFSLNKNYGIVSGLDFSNFYLNASDFSFESKYIAVPISFRAKMIKENSTLYAEFGTNFNYLYKFDFKDNLNNFDDKEKNLGYAFGLFYKIGYKYNFDKNIKINLALFSNQDMSTNFKSDVPESKIKNQMGIELGLAFNL
jgi:hypothetical protein